MHTKVYILYLRECIASISIYWKSAKCFLLIKVTNQFYNSKLYYALYSIAHLKYFILLNACDECQLIKIVASLLAIIKIKTM